MTLSGLAELLRRLERWSMKLPTVLMAVQLARDSCRHPVLNAGSSQHVAMAQLQNLTAPNAAGGVQVELRVQVGLPRAFTLARRCERVATFGNVRQVGSLFLLLLLYKQSWEPAGTRGHCYSRYPWARLETCRPLSSQLIRH